MSKHIVTPYTKIIWDWDSNKQEEPGGTVVVQRRILPT